MRIENCCTYQHHITGDCRLNIHYYDALRSHTFCVEHWYLFSFTLAAFKVWTLLTN